MLGKLWRIAWWIIFPPIGIVLTLRHSKRQRMTELATAVGVGVAIANREGK